MLKHYRWTAVGSDGVNQEVICGRIAVRIENQFELRQLAGPAPPYDLMTRLFGYLDPDPVPEEFQFQPELLEHWNRAMELHAQRQNRWAVQLSTGMSGRVDALLRVERDRQFMDHPIVARLHISMEDKLNEGVGPVWLGDLPPLLDRLAYNSSAKLASQLGLEEVEPFIPPGDGARDNPNHWQFGGALPHSGMVPPENAAGPLDLIREATQ